MPGFMNAELEAIRDNLSCAHCGARFKGSDSQARKVKYESRVVYCSKACRSAAISKKAQEQAIREGRKPRKGVLAGPCQTCGQMFESRTDKMFCSMGCYTQSRQFQEMLQQNRARAAETQAERSKKLRKGQNVPCLECGAEFYQKPACKGHPPRKFCCKTCYRSYMAKRFDRWVANPQSMALPQCYDEFLDSEELECLVDGCDWVGKHLSAHMNLAHGVTAKEFKRAAGFNISTGVVSRPVSEAMRERALVGVADAKYDQDRDFALLLAHKALADDMVRYRSLESREHARKAAAIMGPGPQRSCKGCGKLFQQKTTSGRALYCSPRCRDSAYADQRRKKSKRRSRKPDGTFIWDAP